ncbi:glutamine--fructose-6-phosphate transaminase (isomerizing) [Paenibacillus thalictri]|uniref:Glutamine--fructose-6-phosphate aminotransferase [isomerizing] n=1 Tax=Paenibacillus thalictri TaxID=2527873 RepID=A0A4Q9DGL9_9BACL|nr:glutamine--fructose-6-phosphate transaminase (isomerizing) [Paenibacillus thalictri]TBL70856.1 glutamine--fructose-6-phosphate transaminase (isomerizing) [Paenibacillus thalictri]
MCGIVGYIGNGKAQTILLNGLKKLEYRGYDSAGIAVYDGSRLQVRKSKGRITDLEDHLLQSPLFGTVGIGHTRWATHGKPSYENSHPHSDTHGKFTVVHNGIIENYLELKEMLESKGITFKSETDTEVISHLIAEFYKGDIVAAVQQAIRLMKGAYALAVVTDYEPDKLIAVRLASPLIIGAGNGENFVGSDIPAILEHTRDIYILEDGELAVLTREGVTIKNMNTDEKISRSAVRIDWNHEQAEKGGFEHFMLKEIYEQPNALQRTLLGRTDRTGRNIVFENLGMSNAHIRDIEKITIIACGTAYHAGLVGKQLLERLTRIPVDVDVASEFRYRHPIITDKTLVIAVSQSGETADTLAALKEGRRLGARTLAITNVVGSTIAREADDVILTMAGPEISVASTKAYATQLLVFYMLAFYFARIRSTVSTPLLETYVAELHKVPELVGQILENHGQVKQYAESLKDKSSLFFIGRGLDYSVAMEGSLKLKEISYIHSEAYAAGELKHGTLSLVEEGTSVIALSTQEDLYEKMLGNVKEVKARGAEVYGIALADNRTFAKSVDNLYLLPNTLPLLTPIIAVIPLQLIAYYVSVQRGNDVDKPRNLAKSVTVE